jgi:uncharacterized protein YdeI (YjbR/CyaY-like superfamily)
MAEKKVWDKNNQWTEELDYLKSIINKTELLETTKWGGIIYTLNNKNVLGIGGFKSYFGIWFMNGVFLKDEKKVLVAANEKTKGLRQWRFNSKKEINEKLLLQYIHEAIENEKKGLAIKPEKQETIISDFFATELKKDQQLTDNFSKLSPYKQREYLEYIDTAKQEKTKITRFEKIKPNILQGIGLNDKYRS